MANVIGVPLYRGNSESVRVVSLFKVAEGFTDYFEGQAVNTSVSADGSVTAHPTFGANVGDGVLAGFICDINRKSGKASLVRAAEAVTLPAQMASSVAPGEAISIDAATGKIGTGATGEILTNAVCVSNTVTGIDGKTGLTVPQCVVVRFPALMDLGAV